MLRCEVVPNVKVDVGGKRRTWLVETSGVVNFGNFLEPGAFVCHWADPLETVQGTRRQSLIQFTTGDVLYGCAQFTQDFATQTGHTELQAVKVVSRVDFLAEPATGLRTRVTRQQTFEVKDFAKAVVHLLTATMLVPVRHLLCSTAERHGRVICKAGVLTDKVVVGRVVHVCLARRYSVKDFQSTNKFARSLFVDGQVAIGHVRYKLFKIRCSVIKNREAAGP